MSNVTPIKSPPTVERRTVPVVATTHNTWTVDTTDLILVGMTNRGPFSVFNYGPGNVWCSWRDDMQAGIDDPNSLLLIPNMGYNWEGETLAGQNRKLSLVSDVDGTTVVTVAGG
jgi:hypothetical protein